MSIVFEVMVAERGEWRNREGWNGIEPTLVRVGDEIEVISGGQTFGSGGSTIRRVLFVPPGHELEGQTHIKVPSKIIRREEHAFGVTRYHLVKIPALLQGAELLVWHYDLIGDQPRYFYREVFRIDS